MYRFACDYHIGDFCVRREVRSKDGSTAESGEYAAIKRICISKFNYKLKKRLERMEHEKKMNRTYNRNRIICIGSLAIIILAVFVFGGK